MIGSLQMQSVSPMIKSTNLLKQTPKTKPIKNERLIEFEDGQHSIIDLDMLYGEEPKTNIPPFDRGQKEIFKQVLVDLIDISLTEYNMHYICHTDVELGRPFETIKKKISREIKSFYKF